MTNEILRLRTRSGARRVLLSIAESYPHWLYRRRRIVALVAYSIITAVAYGCGYLIRFEFVPPQDMLHVFRITVLALVAVRLAISWLFRLNNSRWRYSGTRDLVRL